MRALMVSCVVGAEGLHFSAFHCSQSVCVPVSVGLPVHSLSCPPFFLITAEALCFKHEYVMRQDA